MAQEQKNVVKEVTIVRHTFGTRTIVIEMQDWYKFILTPDPKADGLYVVQYWHDNDHIGDFLNNWGPRHDTMNISGLGGYKEVPESHVEKCRELWSHFAGNNISNLASDVPNFSNIDCKKTYGIDVEDKAGNKFRLYQLDDENYQVSHGDFDEHGAFKESYFTVKVTKQESGGYNYESKDIENEKKEAAELLATRAIKYVEKNGSFEDLSLGGDLLTPPAAPEGDWDILITEHHQPNNEHKTIEVTKGNKKIKFNCTDAVLEKHNNIECFENGEKIHKAFEATHEGIKSYNYGVEGKYLDDEFQDLWKAFCSHHGVKKSGFVLYLPEMTNVAVEHVYYDYESNRLPNSKFVIHSVYKDIECISTTVERINPWGDVEYTLSLAEQESKYTPTSMVGPFGCDVSSEYSSEYLNVPAIIGTGDYMHDYHQ